MRWLVVFQVEHCKEEMKTAEALLSVADKAAGTVEEKIHRVFHGVIIHTL